MYFAFEHMYTSIGITFVVVSKCGPFELFQVGWVWIKPWDTSTVLLNCSNWVSSDQTVGHFYFAFKHM